MHHRLCKLMRRAVAGRDQHPPCVKEAREHAGDDGGIGNVHHLHLVEAEYASGDGTAGGWVVDQLVRRRPMIACRRRIRGEWGGGWGGGGGGGGQAITSSTAALATASCLSPLFEDRDRDLVESYSEIGSLLGRLPLDDELPHHLRDGIPRRRGRGSGASGTRCVGHVAWRRRGGHVVVLRHGLCERWCARLGACGGSGGGGGGGGSSGSAHLFQLLRDGE